MSFAKIFCVPEALGMFRPVAVVALWMEAQETRFGCISLPYA